LNIQTALILDEQGVVANLTSGEGNMCFYRALFALFPEHFQDPDSDRATSIATVYAIVVEHIKAAEAEDGPTAKYLYDQLLQEIREPEKDGVNASNLIPLICNKLGLSITLYRVNVKDKTATNHLFEPSTGSKRKRQHGIIIEQPGLAQLAGEETYGMHYLSAREKPRAPRENRGIPAHRL
jgi:hypothetical protein